MTIAHTYSKRVWLNPNGHSSTGSVVVFDGVAAWLDKDIPARSLFVEIADCHGKVRIHQSRTDTRAEFATKVSLLRDTLSDFLEHIREVAE